jgi:hypothetical protein
VSAASPRARRPTLSGLQDVAVAREIRGNRFVVQSEKPRSRVSWQVTGIRKDAFANANRIQPELSKAATEPRRDLGPALFRRLPQSVSGPFGRSAVAPQR